MNRIPEEPIDRLERLISRFLDEEATGAERRELQATLRRDAQAEQLFEETAAFDRELGRAMRAAVGRTFSLGGRRRWGGFLGRLVVGAVAAGLALTIWPTLPGNSHLNRDGATRAGAMNGDSWFAAPGDTMGQVPVTFERPDLETNVEKSYLLVPGKNPNEVLVIEVQRVKSRPRTGRGDF